MATTKTKTPKKTAKAAANGTLESGDVLTLAEAAAYLRVSQDDVLDMVRTQGLPARQIGSQWRFLKSSLQDWLKNPPRSWNKEAFLALSGVWKDDPYLDEMLKEIYKQRGRPMIEEGE